MFHVIHQLPSSESRSSEGEYHLLDCWNMRVQNYGVMSQHNYSHDKFSKTQQHKEWKNIKQTARNNNIPIHLLTKLRHSMQKKT